MNYESVGNQLREVFTKVQEPLAEVFDAPGCRELWLQGEGAEIEDETGRSRGQFVPHRDPIPEEERRADASLERLQAKADASTKKHGKTEADVRVSHT